MSDRTLTGSCLCGEVAFEIRADVQRFYFCHCSQCRKVTGSSHASNLLARPAPVNWLRGADHVRRFDYPGERSFSKVFCSRCGSGLPFVNESETTLYIPAGSLDCPPGIEPDINIFWTDRADWFETGACAPHCPGFPDPPADNE